MAVLEEEKKKKKTLSRSLPPKRARDEIRGNESEILNKKDTKLCVRGTLSLLRRCSPSRRSRGPQPVQTQYRFPSPSLEPRDVSRRADSDFVDTVHERTRTSPAASPKHARSCKARDLSHPLSKANGTLAGIERRGPPPCAPWRPRTGPRACPPRKGVRLLETSLEGDDRECCEKPRETCSSAFELWIYASPNRIYT